MVGVAAMSAERLRAARAEVVRCEREAAEARERYIRASRALDAAEHAWRSEWLLERARAEREVGDG